MNFQTSKVFLESLSVETFKRICCPTCRKRLAGFVNFGADRVLEYRILYDRRAIEYSSYYGSYSLSPSLSLCVYLRVYIYTYIFIYMFVCIIVCHTIYHVQHGWRLVFVKLPKVLRFRVILPMYVPPEIVGCTGHRTPLKQVRYESLVCIRSRVPGIGAMGWGV